MLPPRKISNTKMFLSAFFAERKQVTPQRGYTSPPCYQNRTRRPTTSWFYSGRPFSKLFSDAIIISNVIHDKMTIVLMASLKAPCTYIKLSIPHHQSLSSPLPLLMGAMIDGFRLCLNMLMSTTVCKTKQD